MTVAVRAKVRARSQARCPPRSTAPSATDCVAFQHGKPDRSLKVIDTVDIARRPPWLNTRTHCARIAIRSLRKIRYCVMELASRSAVAHAAHASRSAPPAAPSFCRSVRTWTSTRACSRRRNPRPRSWLSSCSRVNAMPADLRQKQLQQLDIPCSVSATSFPVHGGPMWRASSRLMTARPLAARCSTCSGLQRRSTARDEIPAPSSRTAWPDSHPRPDPAPESCRIRCPWPWPSRTGMVRRRARSHAAAAAARTPSCAGQHDVQHHQVRLLSLRSASQNAAAVRKAARPQSRVDIEVRTPQCPECSRSSSTHQIIAPPPCARR